jgi:predicted tellurium resistance membrane protein TerC
LNFSEQTFPPNEKQKVLRNGGIGMFLRRTFLAALIYSVLVKIAPPFRIRWREFSAIAVQ